VDQGERYTKAVLEDSHWGDEPELVLLAWIMGSRLRLFKKTDNQWVEYAEYGEGETLRRLLFHPRRQHYDLIEVKEARAKERELIEVEAKPRKGGGTKDSRHGVKDMTSQRNRVREQLMANASRQAVKERRARRRALVEVAREAEVEEEDVELLESLARGEWTEDNQIRAIKQVLAAKWPWGALGVTRTAPLAESVAQPTEGCR
jgi:hypothetical protein